MPDKDDQNMLKIHQYNLLKALRFLTIKTVDYVLMCIEITFDTELIIKFSFVAIGTTLLNKSIINNPAKSCNIRK
jgi:hypothetical protein